MVENHLRLQTVSWLSAPGDHFLEKKDTYTADSGFFYIYLSIYKKTSFSVVMRSEVVGLAGRTRFSFSRNPLMMWFFCKRRKLAQENGILTEGDQLLEKESFPLKKNGFTNIIQKITFNILKGFSDDGKIGCRPVFR